MMCSVYLLFPVKYQLREVRQAEADNMDLEWNGTLVSSKLSGCDCGDFFIARQYIEEITCNSHCRY